MSGGRCLLALAVLATSGALAEEKFSCEVNYGKGVGSWETLWSAEEKAWCCEHKGLACPTTSKPLFDCTEGLSNWKLGWSKAKKAWCCMHLSLGCIDAEPAHKLLEKAPEHETAILADADAVLHAAEAKTCGVSAILNSEGKFKPTQSLQPTCGPQMTTNCSISYGGMKCPAGCDFLVPNHRFVCVFECVSADQCSASNSNRAFPNPETGLCTECAIEGCKMCEQANRCTQCHPGFELAIDGGACVFVLDRTMHPDTLVNALKVFVGLLLALAVVWRVVKGQHARHENNMTAIEKARRHRHFCKVQDWALGSNRMVRSLYPLTVNVQKVHILGVGLPLFYTSISFICGIALLFAVGTWAVYTGSPVSQALSATDASAMSLLSTAIRLPAQSPALVLSPMTFCGQASAPDILRQMREFASNNFLLIGVLYVLTFAASLVHGKYQLQAARDYDAKNKTMSDYALRVSGLRRRLTDEEKLREQLQDAFRKACPEVDQEKGLEVYGVSICYNYRDVWNQIDAMKDRFMERVEVDLQNQYANLEISKQGSGENDSIEGFVGVEQTSAGSQETMELQVAEDRKQAKAWFDEDSPEKLSSTGELFVVFRHHKDMNTVFANRDEASRRLQSLSASEDFPVHLHKVFSEPPSINWWHLAVSGAERNTRVRNAMIKILAIIVVVQLCIVLPYAHFIVAPYSSIGTAAGGTKMQIAGMILGNVNMFVSLQIFFTSYGLGFHRKDGMDMMILCANTALVMVNTFFNIVMTALMVFSRTDEGFGIEIFLSMKSLVAISVEGDLAESIYHLMMPGTFFVGYLMCIVMAGIVPFVWNSLLMKIIYIWRCLPDCFLDVLKVFLPWAGDLTLEHYPYRRAERGFEPMEIGISWDYTSMIVTPTVCFCMLFFVSPYVWQTFAMMFASYIFYFCFCRYQHFRLCKTCYYTTNRLDTMANFLWGIPLSVIAAAWCVWGLRSGHLAPDASVPAKLGLVGGAFLSSLLMWVLTYWRLLDPWTQRDAHEGGNATFDEVKADLLYSWFNCNPVFMLKCEFYWQDISRHVGACPRSSEDDATTPAPLKVSIVSARNIRSSDWFPAMGTTDPRCVCEIKNKPLARVETATHSNSNSPMWDHTGELPHYSDGDSLTFSVYDKDILRHDDCVGKFTLTGDQVRAGFDGEVQLDAGQRAHPSYLRIKVQPPQVPLPQTTIHITGATGLHDTDWITRSDPYCVCHVAKRPEDQIVTPVASDQTHPVWDVRTGLTLEVGDELVFTVLDKDVLRKGDVLGTARLTAEQVKRGFKGELELDKAGKRNNASEAKATIKVSVRPPRQQHTGVTRQCPKVRHPIACGEDPDQVRFFEVGKEYLFVNAKKQRLVQKDLYDHLEIETWLEYFLTVWGRITNPCWSKASKALPGLIRHSSRDIKSGSEVPPPVGRCSSSDMLLKHQLIAGP